MRKLKLDTLSTTIYHHDIELSPNILVVEQHYKITGIIEYTLKINHFGKHTTENPIRIYTVVE